MIAPLRADKDKDKATGCVLVFRDVTQQRLMNRAILHHANHDPLTGLVNRREFERRLEHALSGCREHGVPHVLCYLDLDQFKVVNDTAGHAAGDEVLRQVRNVLTSRIRERDTLARLGGDEFSLLLENCPLDKGIEIAESLVTSMRSYRFTWREHLFPLGVSIGLTPITPAAESISHLLSRADIACYTAKSLGRDQIHVHRFEDTESAPCSKQQLRIIELRRGLDQDRLLLYCQPIVALNECLADPLRYEILLRLVDPNGQIMAPARFLPTAERFGLMGSIDRWVINRAFRIYMDLFGNGSDTEIAINLSSQSLIDDAVPGFVHQQLFESGMSPEKVCFEIPETVAIQNLHHARRFVADARELGCRFALDDFGAGLSSLAYLKNLQVDYLKIDGGFVRNMVEDYIDRGMVVAINEVGHIMRARTIAESTHSRQVADHLRTIGVDYAQGFYLGRPCVFDAKLTQKP